MEQKEMKNLWENFCAHGNSRFREGRFFCFIRRELNEKMRLIKNTKLETTIIFCHINNYEIQLVDLKDKM